MLFAHIHTHIHIYILPFPPLQPRISTLFAALESHDLVNGPCLPVYFYHNLCFEPPIACLAHGYNIFATYGLRKAYLCKPRHMYSRKTIYIYIYMHILDTTYWYLDLVSIISFTLYILYTYIYIYKYVYIYICIYIYIYALYIHMSAKKPFLQQQSAWLLRKPPLPCHRGGGEPSGWGGGGVWGSLLI